MFEPHTQKYTLTNAREWCCLMLNRVHVQDLHTVEETLSGGCKSTFIYTEASHDSASSLCVRINVSFHCVSCVSNDLNGSLTRTRRFSFTEMEVE